MGTDVVVVGGGEVEVEAVAGVEVVTMAITIGKVKIGENKTKWEIEVQEEVFSVEIEDFVELGRTIKLLT